MDFIASRQANDAQRTARLLRRSIIADKGQHAIGRDRRFVRAVAGFDARDHLARAWVDNRQRAFLIEHKQRWRWDIGGEKSACKQQRGGRERHPSDNSSHMTLW